MLRSLSAILSRSHSPLIGVSIPCAGDPRSDGPPLKGAAVEIGGDAMAGGKQSPAMRSESGFTLIELLITLSIIGILAALSLTSFFVYKDRAEYAKAETDLRTSLVAFEVGDQDAVPGDALALTYTNLSGGSVPAAMEPYLPKAVTSKGVEIGAQYQYCDSSDPPFQVKMYLTAESCNADKRVEWTRFCGGAEVRLENLPGGHC